METDLIYIAAIVLAFSLGWLFVRVCSNLEGQSHE